MLVEFSKRVFSPISEPFMYAKEMLTKWIPELATMCFTMNFCNLNMFLIYMNYVEYIKYINSLKLVNVDITAVKIVIYAFFDFLQHVLTEEKCNDLRTFSIQQSFLGFVLALSNGVNDKEIVVIQKDPLFVHIYQNVLPIAKKYNLENSLKIIVRLIENCNIKFVSSYIFDFSVYRRVLIMYYLGIHHNLIEKYDRLI